MLGFTTSIILLATALVSSPDASVQAAERPFPTEQTLPTDQPVTLENYVKEFFQDTPILAEIARCESTYRHLAKDGTVLRGKVNKKDVGLMQINEYYHEEEAKRLGFSIQTLEGNLGYAKWLYEKQGSAPWVYSSKCWKK